MDFEIAEIKSSELRLERFRSKYAPTYPTRYFSPLEADLVRNSLYHHSTDSNVSRSPNSISKDKVLVDSVDSVDDEPLFPEPDRDLSYYKLIEWDMSHSLGKFTDFEIEEYECGTEVPRHIL
ncbi:hypothetical protein CQW23_29788 [Capsicum baccatum]|uniref:Uncharacterized protein n=1 Tax=Capsicum baccatum TaxID=33114 RepID=A0A2G2VCF9_CAPBA|nr:hypothetical protein CQW23_29788 [Capsicum baccatum]